MLKEVEVNGILFPENKTVLKINAEDVEETLNNLDMENLGILTDHYNDLIEFLVEDKKFYCILHAKEEIKVDASHLINKPSLKSVIAIFSDILKG